MLNNKGLAFFISLSLSLILSLSIAFFLVSSYNSANVNEALARRARAIVIAEAGINYTLYQLRVDPSYAGETFPAGIGIMTDLAPGMLAGSDWELKITVVGNEIKSKVNYPKARVIFD